MKRLSKKFKIGVFLIGVSCIISGGITAVFYINQFQKEVSQKQASQSFATKKNDTLTLNVNSDTTIMIDQSNDTKLHIEADSAQINGGDISWEYQNKDSQSILTINDQATNTKNIKFFYIGMLLDNTVRISIPQQYKNIIITTQHAQLDLNTLVSQQLTIKNDHGDTMLENISAKTIKLVGKSSYQSVRETVVDKQLTASTNSGDMHLSQVTAGSFDLSSTSGDIDLSSLQQKDDKKDSFIKTSSGDINQSSSRLNQKIESQDGDIYLANVTGNKTIKNRSGDTTIDLAQKYTPLTVTSDHGDISINSESEINKKLIGLTMKTDVGSIYIFDEEKDSPASFGHGKHTMSLTTKTGDIYINDYF